MVNKIKALRLTTCNTSSYCRIGLFILFFFAFFSIPSKAQPYRTICNYAYQKLDDNANQALEKILGGHSLDEAARSMGNNAKDSINKYLRPLKQLRLGGPYTYTQLDSALQPTHLDIINGIRRACTRLYSHKLSRQEQLLNVEILIGLYAALKLPLTEVKWIQARNDFIKRDIFLNDQIPGYQAASANTKALYDAYQLGLRTLQAGDDAGLKQYFLDRGCRSAGENIAISLNDVLGPKVIRIDEPRQHGILTKPGEDPVYVSNTTAGFPGGEDAFYNMIYRKLNYPAIEWTKGIEGDCWVAVVVEKDGSLSHITVEGPVTPRIDSEAVRVIRLSPKWAPAHLQAGGQAVRSRKLFDIRFIIIPGHPRIDPFDVLAQVQASLSNSSPAPAKKFYKPLARFKGDTSAYLLYNFVDQPFRFFNKPLDSLLKLFEAPVKKVVPLFQEADAPDGCYAIELYFYPTQVIDQKIKNKQEPAIFIINWKELLPREPAEDLVRSNASVDKFFVLYKNSNAVIGKIDYVSYYHRQIVEDSLKKAGKKPR